MMLQLEDDKKTFFNDNLRVFSYYMTHLSKTLYHYLYAYKHQSDLDMLIKNLKSTNKLLDDNAMTLFRNFVKYLLKEGEKSAEEISEAIMIPTKDLQPFLSRLIEANIISLKEGKYVSKNE